MPSVSSIKWDEASIKWDEADFAWDEVVTLVTIIERISGPISQTPSVSSPAGGGGGGGFDYAINSLTPKERKKFIKLLCKIEGVEYKETKEIKERRIRITDVELAAREVLGIDIKVDL